MSSSTPDTDTSYRKIRIEESQAADPSAAKGDERRMKIERVHNIAYDGSMVTASVTSTGCTAQEHFELQYEVHNETCYLTLTRNRPDYCRRAPFVINIALPWTPPADCEKLPVAFVNEVVEMQDKQTIPSTQRQ